MKALLNTLRFLTPNAWYISGLGDIAGGAYGRGASGGRRPASDRGGIRRYRSVDCAAGGAAMKVLTIAAVALKRFIRDRANLFFVFVLPIGIILLIGAQFGGGLAPQMGVHLPENGGLAGEAIVEALEEAGEVEIVRLEGRDLLVEAVALGNVAVGNGYPGRSQRKVACRRRSGDRVDRAAGRKHRRLPSACRGCRRAAVTEIEIAIRFAVGRGATREAATAAAEDLVGIIPGISVDIASVGESLFEGVGGQFEIGSTSQLILFMFLTGLTGSAALIQSKRYGVTRRMLSTPTGSSTVVAGEALGRFAVVLVQGLYIVIATMLMFQIDWGDPIRRRSDPSRFWCLRRRRRDAVRHIVSQRATSGQVLAWWLGWGLAALGGCMVPIELFPPAMEAVARFTPHAWALDAFAELQRRDGSLIDILWQLGVIFVFAAVLIGLATWRMRLTLGRAEVSA